MTQIRNFTVSPEQSGKRLDVVLTESGLTRSRAKTLIDEGHVQINDTVISKAGTLLEEGQRVRFEIPATKKMDLTPTDADIRIVYEDESIAVVEKPAGISVHPSTTDTSTTMVHALLYRLKSLSSIGGVERPGIVHRIDKGTSGILVVSKTDQAHAELSAQFKKHTIERCYLALVYGDLSEKGSEGRIETFYDRNPKDRKKMTGKATSGRKAITHWRVVEKFDKDLTLVECKLETGRTHQVRVHLSEMGFPLVGDPIYTDNKRKAKLIKRSKVQRACGDCEHQLLHAYRLEFQHPVTGKHLKFESPLPEDFENCLKTARKD